MRRATDRAGAPRRPRRPGRTLAGALAVLAASLAAACDSSVTAVDVVPEDRFDEVWTRYDIAYPAFGFRDVDWDAARARWRPAAETASTPVALATAVFRLLGELGDRQATVISPSGEVFRSFTDDRPRNFDRDRWEGALAGSNFVERNGGEWGTALFDNVGYLFVDRWADGGGRSFVAEWDRTIDAYAATTSALVLDLRSAASGDEALAFAAIGRFAERPQTAGYTRVRERDGGRRDSLGVFAPRTLRARAVPAYTRPVIVLTGRGTYAISEPIVSALRALPQVIVVGDTTRGSAGNPEVRPLLAGWSFSIQRWVEYTTDREPIEGRGIAPDEFVPWAPPAEPAEDPLLTVAIERARAAAAGTTADATVGGSVRSPAGAADR